MVEHRFYFYQYNPMVKYTMNISRSFKFENLKKIFGRIALYDAIELLRTVDPTTRTVQRLLPLTILINKEKE